MKKLSLLALALISSTASAATICNPETFSGQYTAVITQPIASTVTPNFYATGTLTLTPPGTVTITADATYGSTTGTPYNVHGAGTYTVGLDCTMTINNLTLQAPYAVTVITMAKIKAAMVTPKVSVLSPGNNYWYAPQGTGLGAIKLYSTNIPEFSYSFTLTKLIN